MWKASSPAAQGSASPDEDILLSGQLWLWAASCGRIIIWPGRAQGGLSPAERFSLSLSHSPSPSLLLPASPSTLEEHGENAV